jgi:crooked neck
MEEMLGNIAGARQVFERWMEWEPEEQAWHSYINLELRFKEFERARTIYERFVYVHPEVKNWIKYAKFEEKHGNIGIYYTLMTSFYHIRAKQSADTH